MPDKSNAQVIGAIDTVIAFRHVGPFPEWAAHHPRHKDVLLCPDCLEDWCEAMIDPTFDDRVIEQGVIYLDDEGQETAEVSDRYIEAVTRAELLELPASYRPTRCDACHTPLERVEGIRVSYR